MESVNPPSVTSSEIEMLAETSADLVRVRDNKPDYFMLRSPNVFAPGAWFTLKLPAPTRTRIKSKPADAEGAPVPVAAKVALVILITTVLAIARFAPGLARDIGLF